VFLFGLFFLGILWIVFLKGGVVLFFFFFCFFFFGGGGDLLTVHFSLFILVINQLDAQNFCFTISIS